MTLLGCLPILHGSEEKKKKGPDAGVGFASPRRGKCTRAVMDAGSGAKDDLLYQSERTRVSAIITVPVKQIVA